MISLLTYKRENSVVLQRIYLGYDCIDVIFAEPTGVYSSVCFKK